MKQRREQQTKRPRKPRSFSRGKGARAYPLPLAPPADQPIPAVAMNTEVQHPLIYRKRLTRVDSAARPGDLVAVYVEPDQLFGYGLFNGKSEIAVRMLSYGADLPDEQLWRGLLQRAVQLRQDVLGLNEAADTYRVVHAEGDRLPGLVIDRFGDVLSAEAFSLGMYQRCDKILPLLASITGAKHWLAQPGPQTLAQEGFEAQPLQSADCPRSVVVQEHGTKYRVRFEGGHKTGFFCDQRDNRRLLAKFCTGGSVLDLCCYTGGFAIAAKHLGNADEVVGVDLDEGPLKLARENARLNHVEARFVQADVFPYMRDMLREGKRFDTVILDPSKLIRSRKEIEEGTRKHFDLNRLAMQLVKPGGLLLSCSCAGLLPWDDFVRLLYAASRQAGPPSDIPWPDGRPRHLPRDMQVIAKTGAGGDHPIHSTCPETEYLKAVWMRMM